MSSSKEQEPSIRKRKAHKKSRAGCANCKIRRVKCDETKPACTRCQSFSLTCSYTTATSSVTPYESIMQPAIPVMQFDLSQPAKPEPFSLPDTLPLPLGNGMMIELPSPTYGLIRDFEENIPLMDTAFDRLECKRIMMSLALKYPWLWHAILALVLIHQDLRAPLAAEGKAPTVSDLMVPSERGFFITFHKLHAAMFLSRYLPEKHTADQDLQDAIFAGSVLMGHVLWAAHDAPEGPYTAWPIRQPEDIDLEWLTICRRREAITQLIMPERPVGAFAGQRLVWGGQWLVASPGWSEEFELFPMGVRGLLDLDGASRVERNPYHATASVMGKCLGIPAGKDSLCTYLSFLKVIDDRFLRMLKQKDLGALVVLVWWYARLLECGVVTEALRRAVVEGWAICLYLESWGGKEGNIREALEYPKIVLRRFRYQVTNNWVSSAGGKEGVTLKLSLQAGTRDLKDL